MWFAIIFAWNVGGILMLGALMHFGVTIFYYTEGLEFLNPYVIYKLLKVNQLGAILVCLLFNILCPVLSLGYWFYKLCTIGRR